MFFKNNTIKFLCVSFLIFSSLFSASQKSVIFKNVNVLAEELKQNLNSVGDSLLLEGERPIYKVEIFNSEFSTEFRYKSKSVSVPVSDLPVGRYTVLVRLHDKLIAINLLRKEPFNTIKHKEFREDLDTDIAKLNKTNEREANGKKSKSNINETTFASGKKLTHITKNETKSLVKGYWVVKTSQGHIGTKTIRHFATAEDLDYLLSRIELEHKTRTGKHNTLTIWEVYNLDQFKIEHAKNRNYIKVKDSPHFNIEPYYASKTAIDK